MPKNLCGQEATEMILQEAQGKKAEAAEWCSRYAFDGLEAGKMFLPSKRELECVFAHYKRLNQSFAQIGHSGIQNGFYWSSSELGSGYAWFVSPSSGTIGNYYRYKSDSRPVRCVLAF